MAKTIKIELKKPGDQLTMTRIGLRLVLLIAIGATIGCDRVTKHVAATTLSEASSRSFLADTFRLEMSRIRARSWVSVQTGRFRSEQRSSVSGMGCSYLPWPSSPCGVAGPDGLCRRRDLRSRWCLQPPGSDHVGMVIDFMNVGIGPLRTGIFNVADMAIMLGAGIFVLEGYRSARGRAFRPPRRAEIRERPAIHRDRVAIR